MAHATGSTSVPFGGDLDGMRYVVIAIMKILERPTYKPRLSYEVL